MTDDIDVEDSVLSTDAPFVINFARVLSNLLKTQYAAQFAAVSDDTLRWEVQDAIESLLPEIITLNTSRPDFDSVLLRLMREIEKGDAWKDTTLSSTGQMILRLLASDIDFAQFSIMRALQEVFPHTARNPSSIYAAARSNGIHIQRNQPVSCTARLTRHQDQVGLFTIPAWTQFNIAEIGQVFNRQQINLAEVDVDTIVTLHQGEIKSSEVMSSGAPLQVIEIGDETFSISDTDLRVFVNSVEWKRSEASIWNASGTDKVFWENTLPNGNVEIRFGDGIWGVAPPPDVVIKVMWAETTGGDGEDLRTGLEVYWRDTINSNVLQMETITPLLNGQNRLSVNYYRTFSGDRRGADGGSAKRAILRKDFRAHAVTYPGVFDAVFRGAAELAPGKRSWMNVLGVTLLTDPVFSNSQWSDFVSFMKGGGDYEGLTLDNLELLRLDPTFVPLNIKASVHCRINADLASVKARLTKNLTQAMTPRIGSLGFNFYKSDIYDLLTGLPPAQLFGDLAKLTDMQDLAANIEYVTLDEPVEDLLLDTPLKWVKLGTIELDVKYSRSRRAGFEGFTPDNTLDIPEEV